jgi:hypothetical protein
MDIQQLLTGVDNNPFLYDKIEKDAIKDLSDKDRLLNVVIGVRGRSNFLYPCINHLKQAIGNKPIVITMVEQDTQSNYQTVCKDLCIDYIFINNSEIIKGEKFNRAFCFNAGFLFTKKSKWYLFHDIDMLVKPEFFDTLFLYIEHNPKWLQPYTKKRVLLLSKDITGAVCSRQVNLKDLLPNKDYKAAQSGSTGGCILVRNDIFIQVGGFDPELFYGYGPEDSFFWSKLEVADKEVGVLTYHFAGGGMFADDPPIEIYHMYHEPTYNTNPDQSQMLFLREIFWKSAYPDKLKVLESKRSILQKFLRIQ